MAQVTFSEESQAAARDILSRGDDNRYTHAEVFHIVEAHRLRDDLIGCHLVIQAWISQGNNFPNLIKFARDSKNHEVFGKTLSWLRDNLVGSSAKVQVMESNAAVNDAEAWCEKHKGE